MSAEVETHRKYSSFQGLLLGCAVGDAVGLPGEGISPQRIQRMWGSQWQHRFLFGRGMISDDTEHTIFVAQALLAHPDNPDRFQRALANQLRFWLLGLPAGIGLATLKSILKLWVGFSPNRSGVYSAGNGPAMRSAIIGAYFADKPELRADWVRASTRITHTDPRAEIAAIAVANAAAWIVNQSGDPAGFLPVLMQQQTDAEWQKILVQLNQSLATGETTAQLAVTMGLEKGVSGYAYHSVPIALYAWLRHPYDFRAALESVLNCGGDTDTVGAIVGALVGAQVGADGIPRAWLVGLVDWPRSRGLLNELASRLEMQLLTGKTQGPAKYFWPGLAVRNLLFIAVVLTHGFRRLLPPY